MTGLDHRLRVLRRYVRAEAPALRSTAQELDAHPDGSTLYPKVPLLDRLATLQIPRPYARDPLVIEGHEYFLTSAVERVVFHEEAAAHGDAALLLSAPGSLTAGMLVAALGDDTQQRAFFERVRARPTWTFLAMTEPQGGSDAGTLHTTLTPCDGGYLLNGSKRFIGNAHRSPLGVVTARTGPGPLGIRCALVDTTHPGCEAGPLATLGMRGALGTLDFQDVFVPEAQVLGRHLSPTRRGMWGWLHAFNPLRCVAAALGVGIARAAHAYAHQHLPSRHDLGRRRLDTLGARIRGVQSLTRFAATAVDADPANAHLPSAAKSAAADLAVEATSTALRMLGPGARLEHPLLDKWARDAFGIECMEGTSHVQSTSVFNALTRADTAPR
ncbi:acyl-CoA dehydrogenase family protein [Streptomyces sp. enrichment culture]|uniref:acyl-CoA dehydrogenase family protein n=1 Tax=Streptomyces sp. enrichment culture TaxID=1795815 RepID=UPI003F5437E2